MNYEIKGAPMPVVECRLEAGESIKCEGGSMSWMSANMKMETSGGGIGKMFTKAISGEKMFQNIYTAQGGPGMIAFASSFPGNIVAVELTPGHDIVCQKSSYLASTSGVELSIFFQKKLGAGFFGGEGFIMQRLSGTGLVFLEIDTGYLALMDASCSIDIQAVGGVKNALLGGEGLFNTVVSGPGKVTLQSMPEFQLANSIRKYIPTQSH